MKWAARSARSQAIKFDPLVGRRLVAPGRVSLLVRLSNGNATRIRTPTFTVASTAILFLPKVTVLTRASETSARIAPVRQGIVSVGASFLRVSCVQAGAKEVRHAHSDRPS